jgi:hypothetical protein
MDLLRIAIASWTAYSPRLGQLQLTSVAGLWRALFVR